MILSPRFEKSTFFLRKSNILRELIWGERFYFFFYREVEVSKGGLDKLNAPFPVCYQFNPWQDHHNVIGSGHSHCLSLPLQHIKIKYIGHKKTCKKAFAAVSFSEFWTGFLNRVLINGRTFQWKRARGPWLRPTTLLWPWVQPVVGLQSHFGTHRLAKPSIPVVGASFAGTWHLPMNNYEII